MSIRGFDNAYRNYNNWLVAPMERMEQESEWFYNWAEGEGYNLDDPEQFKLAEEEYENYLEIEAEEQALRQYEAYQERLEEEAEEREWDGWNESGWDSNKWD